MEVCEHHSGLEANIDELKADVSEIKTILEKVRDRLPNWAVAVQNFLFFAIGILGTLLAIAYK